MIPTVDSGHLEVLSYLIADGFCLCEIITDDAGAPVDYRFLKVNDAFAAATGLEDAEGHTAYELVPELEPYWAETYGKVALGRESMIFESAAPSMQRIFEVQAHPVDPPGRFALVFRDITKKRNAQKAQAEALDRAGHLLRELNHRVANSLAMITSIVTMEMRTQPEGTGGRQALERVRNRIGAVANLYGTLGMDPAGISVRADHYLGKVINGLSGAMGDAARIRFEAEIAPVDLDARCAVPLGLIANELVTNAMKYAFPESAAEGVIRIRLTQDADGTCVFSVSDNGVGMQAAPGTPQASATGSAGSGTGHRLIGAFAQQIDGQISTGPGTDGAGTRVTVRFQRPLGAPEALHGHGGM